MHDQRIESPQPPPPAPLPFKKRVQTVAAMLAGVGLIHAVGKSTRLRGPTPQDVDQFRGPSGGPVLAALWHGVHFAPLYLWRGRGGHVVTSRSADGAILTRILAKLGYDCIRGSTSRGGRRALIDLVRVVKAGSDICVAVDGPRGPARRVKPGIILLAKATGRPIIPVASTASIYWRFQSWDRFRLPLPLSRSVVVAGDPIYIAPDADRNAIEAARKSLEETLERMQAELEAEVRPWVWRLPDRRPRDRVYK